MVFAAPNIWGGTSETEDGLKKLDKSHGIKETEVKLRNPDGKINPGSRDDGNIISTAINYIKKGGGRYKARRGRKTIFNSEDNVIKLTSEKDSPIQEVEIRVVYALATWLMSRR